jgi:molecular chaperone GrpE (heat shock protein)
MKEDNFTEADALPEDQPEPAVDQSQENETVAKGPGLLYHLFNPETRFGRFMRSFTRVTGVIICLFGFGFLTAYLLLYQPRLNEMNQAREEVKAMTEKLNQAEGTLSAAQQYLNETNTKYEQASARLETEENHNAMLRLLAEVNNARAALASKDGASARLILQNTRKLLDGYLPVINAHSPEMAVSFDARLTLVQNEFSRDPETALADLKLMADNLLDLEKILYK